MKKYIVLTTLLPGTVSYLKETSFPVHVDFSYEMKDENRTSLVTLSVKNLNSGTDFYKWTFEGGIPASSDERNPEPGHAGNRATPAGIVFVERTVDFCIPPMPEAMFDGETGVLTIYGSKGHAIEEACITSFEFSKLDVVNKKIQSTIKYQQYTNEYLS